MARPPGGRGDAGGSDRGCPSAGRRPGSWVGRGGASALHPSPAARLRASVATPAAACAGIQGSGEMGLGGAPACPRKRVPAEGTSRQGTTPATLHRRRVRRAAREGFPSRAGSRARRGSQPIRPAPVSSKGRAGRGGSASGPCAGGGARRGGCPAPGRPRRRRRERPRVSLGGASSRIGGRSRGHVGPAASPSRPAATVACGARRHGTGRHGIGWSAGVPPQASSSRGNVAPGDNPGHSPPSPRSSRCAGGLPVARRQLSQARKPTHPFGPTVLKAEPGVRAT